MASFSTFEGSKAVLVARWVVVTEGVLVIGAVTVAGSDFSEWEGIWRGGMERVVGRSDILMLGGDELLFYRNTRKRKNGCIIEKKVNN